MEELCRLGSEICVLTKHNHVVRGELCGLDQLPNLYLRGAVYYCANAEPEAIDALLLRGDEV